MGRNLVINFCDNSVAQYCWIITLYIACQSLPRELAMPNTRVKNDFNLAFNGAKSTATREEKEAFILFCKHVRGIAKVLREVKKGKACGISLLYDHLTDLMKYTNTPEGQREPVRRQGCFIHTNTPIKDEIPDFRPWENIPISFAGSVQLCEFINAHPKEIGYKVTGRGQNAANYKCGTHALTSVVPI